MIPTEWPCLSITQTRGWEPRDRADDRFVDYASVVAWAVEQHLLSGPEAEALLAEASRRPDDATRTLEGVLDVRALLYRTFVATARDDAPARADLAELNRHLAAAMTHRRLRVRDDGWAWGWEDDPSDLGRVMWPVVHAAAELLTSDLRPRVKLCEGDGCGWLFVDASRNRSRRWCDMSDCGNLAKVRRFRRRHSDHT